MKKAKNEGVANALAAELGCEKETAELVCKRIQARRLVKMLTAERVRHNLSQKEIAAKMDCSESKISRMESSNDVDLNFGDILAYARAAGINMSVLFDDSTLPNATRIKHCVFAIASMLQHLTDLAKDEDEDDSIRNAINKFQVEVLMNFLIKYRESGAALPSIRFDDPPPAGEVQFAGAQSESCGTLVH